MQWAIPRLQACQYGKEGRKGTGKVLTGQERGKEEGYTHEHHSLQAQTAAVSPKKRGKEEEERERDWNVLIRSIQSLFLALFLLLLLLLLPVHFGGKRSVCVCSTVLFALWRRSQFSIFTLAAGRRGSNLPSSSLPFFREKKKIRCAHITFSNFPLSFPVKEGRKEKKKVMSRDGLYFLLRVLWEGEEGPQRVFFHLQPPAFPDLYHPLSSSSVGATTYFN